jgi:hypothetical protein
VYSIGSLFILLLFTTISEQTTSITFEHPSYITYRKLYEKYSDKLVCTCNEITPKYLSFINVTPVYHPVCSSAFVEQIWFDQLKLIKPVGIFTSDWRLMSLGFFQSLAALCKLAHNTVNNDLQQFRGRTLVTTRLLNEALLHGEMNDTLDELIHTMQTEFERVLSSFQLLFQVNQYFSGLTYNGYIRVLYQADDGQIKVK